MTNDVSKIVEEIHSAPQKAVIAVAGAGSQAVAWLLGVGGASRTVLEALVPYSPRSMVEFLGYEPEQFVSPQTASEMAKAAYRRARHLQENPPGPTPRPPLHLRWRGGVPTRRDGGEAVVGLACTASIATDRVKRGEHRCCVAAWDENGITAYSLQLTKGQRSRADEEDVVSRLLLHALAKACGITPNLSLGLLDAERLEVQYLAHDGPVQRLLAGEASTVTVHPHGRMVVDDPTVTPTSSGRLWAVPPPQSQPMRGTGILAGSFSPLHQGHVQLAYAASEIIGADVFFELSVVNVDKPPLSEEVVHQRLDQFRGKGRVILTRAPTFRQKADLFPGCTFVLGWDTAMRLLEPRYYGGQEAAMLLALAEMWAAGCHFLVAGRYHEGRFRTISDLPIPQGFRPLFQAIPESRFRSDISSTALRTGS